MKELRREIGLIIGNALVNHGTQVPGSIVDEILSLIAKTESGAQVLCSDGLCALLETWKEVLKGFDRLIETEQVRDLKLMLMGSQNATKEMIERLEQFIEEST